MRGFYGIDNIVVEYRTCVVCLEEDYSWNIRGFWDRQHEIVWVLVLAINEADYGKYGCCS